MGALDGMLAVRYTNLNRRLARGKETVLSK